jgi:hypothetical protein
MYIQKRDSLPSDRVYMPFQRLLGNVGLTLPIHPNCCVVIGARALLIESAITMCQGVTITA